ncbi:hypothetical protein [Leucobacter aridicollis]|uniref:hypothetical protein n=1 Tax=Leucobacter aridicollis TaxID=283878 RepID=UPI0021046EEB|nr:hypothetical protein [Leucobacter aridicollis]UTX52089.1 hypothetical protein KI794_09940 [Leucobacter aridicollis]
MPRLPLNTAQLEVLTWVRDGAPDGVYEGYEHRIVARALHNRGLVEVKGHGKQWQASITEDGAYYADHGDYPPQEDSERPAADEKAPSPAERPSRDSAPAPAPRKPAVRKQGPTAAMMTALLAAPDNRIEIDYDEHHRYEQLAKTAERFKKVPEGMQVTVESDWRKRTVCVRLHPLPEWRMRVLDPVPVPASLRGASEVVKNLRDREDFEISASEKNRALRLAQALVAEAELRGHKAKFIKPPPKDRWGYVQKHDRNQGHLMLVLGPDEYRLSLFQISKNVEHVLSKTEAKRAEQGHWVQKWDVVPTERLGIRVETHGVSFWGSEWKDTADRPLEDSLAQVLQELELRHEAEERSREAAERARIERQRRWEIAREQAVQELTDSHRAKELAEQAKRWKRAADIREYADAVEQRALAEPDDDARREALEWAQWAREYADRVDPLRQRLRLPETPKATEKALQPFMGGWSAYGPESTYRG